MASLPPHKHVCLFIGVVAGNLPAANGGFIIQELCDGSLADLIYDHETVFPTARMHGILRGVSAGLMHISAGGVVTNDIAARK